MNSSEVTTVFRKELKETVRDWRTLCVGILVPLILYPLSLIVVSKIMVERRERNEAKVVKIAVTGDGASWFTNQFTKDPQLDVIGLNGLTPVNALKQGKVDVVVNVPADMTGTFDASAETPEITVQVDELKDSSNAFNRVTKKLTDLRLQLSSRRLETAGISSPWLKPLEFTSENVETNLQRSGAWLSLTLPVTIVLLVLTGTLFPALDLITGERERGTLPILLVSSAQRASIVYGKLLVVYAIGVFTVTLLMVSLASLLGLGLHKVDDGAGAFTFTLSSLKLFALIPLALPLVLMFGAAAVWISAYSRNFQQGQGYSVPYLLGAMFLAMVSIFPVNHLPAAIYVVPISNVCVCMTDILRGRVIWWAIATTFVSSALYGLYVSRIAIDLMSKEEILFKIQESPLRRKDFDRVVAVLYACTFIAMFYIGQIAQMLDKVYGMIATQLVVIALPSIATVMWLRLPMKETFSFRKPKLAALIGAPLMAPGSVLLTALIANVQSSFLPMSESYARMLTDYMLPKGQPMWLILVAMAVMPGLCEEIMFRGAIYGLLRRRISAIKCCFIVGILFGLFHLSGYRLLPTATLGIVLTFMVYRSSSIFPGMLFHASHNALAILATSVPESQWMSTPVIVGAVLSTIVGAVLEFKFGKVTHLRKASSTSTTDLEHKAP
ncbi:MAG TPA: ABC transporter permease subunit/CPBP intramembrane protease [Drouetiella sp.]